MKMDQFFSGQIRLVSVWCFMLVVEDTHTHKTYDQTRQDVHLCVVVGWVGLQ